MVSTMQDVGKATVVTTGYDNGSPFMVRKGGEITLPADFLKQHNLQDATAKYAANDNMALDLPTDDWPFFYMDVKMYPASYVMSLALVLALSIAMIYNFLPGQRWQVSLLPVFLLVAGFM